jgi:hypothetical protein
MTGAHTSVTCARCHTNPNTFGGLSLACASCHNKPSSHTGAMATNCGTCHSTRAWTPATFDHAQSGFPLTNAHAGLLCTRCHTNPNTFGGLSPACVSCHSSPSSHPGFYGTVCTKCHTTAAFMPVRYTATHIFPLTHRGAAQVCTACHTTTFSAYTCGRCHDPSKIEDHAGRSLSNCASCHPRGRGGD